MTGRRPASRIVALLAACLVAVVAAGCSAEPRSEVTATQLTAGTESAPVAQPSPGETPSASAEPGDATAAPTSEGPAKPTPGPASGPPPKPGNPTWKLVGQTPATESEAGSETWKATWTYPDGVATRFVLYGVKDCLRYAKKYDNKPCLVKGMRIPKDQLVQVKELPGDARSTTITYETGVAGGLAGPPPWSALLVRAVNDGGNSIFTIVWSDTVCWQCTY